MGRPGALSRRDLLRRSALAGGTAALLPVFASDARAGGSRRRQRRTHAYSFFASEAVNFEALFAFGAVAYGTADFGELTTIVDRVNARGATYDAIFDDASRLTAGRASRSRIAT